jgi:hypothetical protein
MIDQTLFSAGLPSRGSWEAKREALHSYRWSDRGAGMVKIPIDRAMRLLAERGHVQ